MIVIVRSDRLALTYIIPANRACCLASLGWVPDSLRIPMQGIVTGYASDLRFTIVV